MNNDRFKEIFKLKEMLDEENKKNRINDVKLIFSNIYDFIETTCKPSRETSLAMTKLEEAQFWAIKGISREVNK